VISYIVILPYPDSRFYGEFVKFAPKIEKTVEIEPERPAGISKGGSGG
jgi:hypothetical protein